jgi:hypothetical protein
MAFLMSEAHFPLFHAHTRSTRKIATKAKTFARLIIQNPTVATTAPAIALAAPERIFTPRPNTPPAFAGMAIPPGPHSSVAVSATGTKVTGTGNIIERIWLPPGTTTVASTIAPPVVVALRMVVDNVIQRNVSAVAGPNTTLSPAWLKAACILVLPLVGPVTVARMA